MLQEHDTVRHIFDTAAVGGTIAYLLQWIPVWSVVVTAIYLTFRLWEMKTTQQIVAWIKRKLRR